MRIDVFVSEDRISFHTTTPNRGEPFALVGKLDGFSVVTNTCVKIVKAVALSPSDAITNQPSKQRCFSTKDTKNRIFHCHTCSPVMLAQQ